MQYPCPTLPDLHGRLFLGDFSDWVLFAELEYLCRAANQTTLSLMSGRSYRPKGYVRRIHVASLGSLSDVCFVAYSYLQGVSPALQRAREPYRLRNAVTGTLLVAFAVSVWAYSISAVKQDNFDDVDAAALNQRQNAQVAPSPPPR